MDPNMLVLKGQGFLIRSLHYVGTGRWEALAFRMLNLLTDLHP